MRRALPLVLLGFFFAAACATSTAPSDEGSGSGSASDAGEAYDGYGGASNDSGSSSSSSQDASKADTGGGNPGLDAGTHDTGSSSTQGSGDCDPNNAIYAAEYLAAAANGKIKLCASGCSATECCYGSIACVGL